MRTKFYFLTILVLVTAILSGCAGVAAAQSLNQASEPSAANLRTLNVNGTGKVYLTPDIAYVTIGVHTENKDAAQAVSENNAGSSKVKDALTGLGVELSDIQTQNFSIYPQQQYDSNGRPTGEITYIVDNQIYVTVRDLAT
ncbi:MAG: SIMPL domain-containing protein, partial [Anaerolineales bacterium]|nr:SIMPL domain-containing protein [Anaerolineales bacterium]